MKKQILSLAIIGSMLGTAGIANASTSWTTSSAVKKYNKYINADSYVKDELYNVADFHSKYGSRKNTLAYQIVERAIWYMKNGYMVYGSGYDAYGKYGYEDCSGFVRFVYGDFGFNITGTSAKYNTVGKKVAGVGKKKVNGKWKLTGVENLKLGDILTWQTTDHIMHVAIYMGTNREGQPVVIGTRSDGNPTALGTVDSWQYWWGENFKEARRVVPSAGFTGMAGKKIKAPTIPKKYILPPQKKVPAWTGSTAGTSTENSSGSGSSTANPSTPSALKTTYVITVKGWVSLKSSAKSSSSTVGRLELGEKAELIKKANKYWYQVKVNGKTAYITTSSTYTKTVTK
ncbi:NlpC/P60 family protein [Paenibacillus glycanilyticus]|uniref:NlpC/P60 family protein n=1 Tax=Paenibacillus glycanilyticus TaxID=126569 RepID=UPI003EBF31E1